MERTYYIEINDKTKLNVKPFGILSKIMEWLFVLLRSLGYEEIKIEVFVDDGEGQATVTDSTSNQEE